MSCYYGWPCTSVQIHMLNPQHPPPPLWDRTSQAHSQSRSRVAAGWARSSGMGTSRPPKKGHFIDRHHTGRTPWKVKPAVRTPRREAWEGSPSEPWGDLNSGLLAFKSVRQDTRPISHHPRYLTRQPQESNTIADVKIKPKRGGRGIPSCLSPWGVRPLISGLGVRAPCWV